MYRNELNVLIFVFSRAVQSVRSATVDEHDVDRHVDGVHARVRVHSDIALQARRHGRPVQDQRRRPVARLRHETVVIQFQFLQLADDDQTDRTHVGHDRSDLP